LIATPSADMCEISHDSMRTRVAFWMRIPLLPPWPLIVSPRNRTVASALLIVMPDCPDGTDMPP
jgi:hypothetical protein